ncbi:MAG: endonuclease V [Planctomycetota bacterium]
MTPPDLAILDEAVASIPDVRAAIATLCATIPAGRLATFGDLAAALGDRRAALGVTNAIATDEPTGGHRVISQTGRVGTPDFAALLSEEGVPVSEDGVSAGALAIRRHEPPPTDDPPFVRMRALADDWAKRETYRELFEFKSGQDVLVGGLDVSYPSPFHAVAAAVVMRLTAAGIQPVSEATAAVDIAVPYVAGYLAFRELPAYAAVLKEVEAHPAVWLVDGNGRLHPRRAGVATLLGNLINVPTVGVAKNLLCGTAGDDGLIRDDEEVIGAILDEENGGPRKKLYISPGSRIACGHATAVSAACRFGHRLPEPVYRADRISRSGPDS